MKYGNILTLLICCPLFPMERDTREKNRFEPLVIVKTVGTSSLQHLAAQRVGELAASGAYGTDQRNLDELNQYIEHLSPSNKRQVKLALMRAANIYSELVAAAPGPGIFSPDGTKIAYCVIQKPLIGVDVYGLPDHRCISSLKKFEASELLPVWSLQGTHLIRRFINETVKAYMAQLWRVDHPTSAPEKTVSNLSLSKVRLINETAGISYQPNGVITFQSDSPINKQYDSDNSIAVDKSGVHLPHYPTQELVHIISQGSSRLIDTTGAPVVETDGIIKAFSPDGSLMVEYLDQEDSFRARIKNRTGALLLELDKVYEKAYINPNATSIVFYDPEFEELFDLTQPEKGPLLELESSCITQTTERFLPDLESFLRITYDKKSNSSQVTHNSIDGNVLAEWQFPNYTIKNVGFCLDQHKIILHDNELGEKIILDIKSSLATRFNTDRKCSSSIKKQSPVVGLHGYYLNKCDDGSYELRRMIDPDQMDFLALMARVMALPVTTGNH